jgi:hypothetical protein
MFIRAPYKTLADTNGEIGAVPIVEHTVSAAPSKSCRQLVRSRVGSDARYGSIPIEFSLDVNPVHRSAVRSTTPVAAPHPLLLASLRDDPLPVVVQPMGRVDATVIHLNGRKWPIATVDSGRRAGRLSSPIRTRQDRVVVPKKVIPARAARVTLSVFRCHGGASPEAFRVVAAGYRPGAPSAMVPPGARRTRLGEGPRSTRV